MYLRFRTTQTRTDSSFGEPSIWQVRPLVRFVSVLGRYGALEGVQDSDVSSVRNLARASARSGLRVNSLQCGTLWVKNVRLFGR